MAIKESWACLVKWADNAITMYVLHSTEAKAIEHAREMSLRHHVASARPVLVRIKEITKEDAA